MAFEVWGTLGSHDHRTDLTGPDDQGQLRPELLERPRTPTLRNHRNLGLFGILQLHKNLIPRQSKICEYYSLTVMYIYIYTLLHDSNFGGLLKEMIVNRVDRCAVC